MADKGRVTAGKRLSEPSAPKCQRGDTQGAASSEMIPNYGAYHPQNKSSVPGEQDAHSQRCLEWDPNEIRITLIPKVAAQPGERRAARRTVDMAAPIVIGRISVSQA